MLSKKRSLYAEFILGNEMDVKRGKFQGMLHPARDGCDAGFDKTRR